MPAADTDADQRSLLSLSETARRAGVSRRQVRNAIDAGELRPSFIAGRAWIHAAWREHLRRGPGSLWCGHAAIA
jgi:hypothetical protein